MDDPTTSQQLQERDTLMVQLKDDLSRSQQRMKAYEDDKRKEVQLFEGYYVFVKLQPQTNICGLTKTSKVECKVLELIGPVAYKLQLLMTTGFIPYFTFHISLLKKCVGDPQQVTR